MRASFLVPWLLSAVASASPPPAEPTFAADLPLDDTLTAEQQLGAQVMTEADDALKLARKQLDAGKLDDALAALEGRAFPESRKPEAGALLAKVAENALARDDTALALLAAQLSLRQQKNAPAALSVAARVCRKSQEFSAAEKYADQWIAAEPKQPEARLLRAEVAFDQGEWQRTLELLKPLSKASLDATQAERRDGLAEKSRQELEAIEKGTAVQRSVEKKVRALKDGKPAPRAKPAEKPRKARPPAPAPLPEPPRVAAPFDRNGADVVMFTTTWCGGFCKKARSWMKLKGIRFVERDIEQDPTAADALNALAKQNGVLHRGVPAFDVRGQFVQGLDPDAIEAALR